MALFSRPPRVPEELKALIPRGEKLMAWATHGGGVLAVTNNSLISIDHHETQIRNWDLALQARWDEPVLTLVVQDSLDSPPITLGWQLSEPGQVPQAVRDRVTGAVLVDQVHQVAEVGRVRFVARRSGESVTWTAVADDYEAAHTPIGLENVAVIQRQLQASFGI